MMGMQPRCRQASEQLVLRTFRTEQRVTAGADHPNPMLAARMWVRTCGCDRIRLKQWSYYGKVGGALTIGNEDRGKHVSAQILYALQHIGLEIPSQSDA